MALEAELLPAERESIAERPTDFEAAYVLYLRARAVVPNLSPSMPIEFFDDLNRAVAIDPQFGLAHATLAFSYALASEDSTAASATTSYFGLAREEKELLTLHHAEQALTLDPNQGLAYGARARLDVDHWRLSDAEANWERARRARAP